jgi:hypothetical protein
MSAVAASSPFISDAASIDRAIAVHAAADRHIQSEFGNSTDEILATIDVDRPLCFAANAPQPDGAHRLACMSTVEQIRAHYDQMRQALDVISFQAFTTIRRDWMLFEQGMTTFRDVASNATVVTDAIVLFPADADKIHGELGWVFHPGAKVGDPRSEEDPAPRVKVANHERHNRAVAALRAGDVNALIAEFDTEVGVGLRDYAAGEPYQVHQGVEAARAFFTSFYDAFEVAQLDVVSAIASEWFLFSELSWAVVRRNGPDAGARLRFATATMYPLLESGAITAVIGYGTDPVVT